MRFVAALVLVSTLAACGGDDDDPVTTSTGAPATTSAALTPVGFERVQATATAADGTVCELCLWLADTARLRERGLMDVTDLGDADAMVFRYDVPRTTTFWMKDTPLPLSIAFYDAGGAFLDSFDMVPCAADPCLHYATPTDFTYAIEAPEGGLDALGLTPGSTLVVTDLPCA